MAVASMGLPRNSGSTMSPAERDWVNTYWSSRAWKAGLTVTRITPAMAQPNSRIIHSGTFGAHTASRSPGSKWARIARAARSASTTSSA